MIGAASICSAGSRGVEGGEGGGGGGEAFGVLGFGFVGLGAACGGEGAEEVAGERVGWVDLGHGNGSGLKRIWEYGGAYQGSRKMTARRPPVRHPGMRRGDEPGARHGVKNYGRWHEREEPGAGLAAGEAVSAIRRAAGAAARSMRAAVGTCGTTGDGPWWRCLMGGAWDGWFGGQGRMKEIFHEKSDVGRSGAGETTVLPFSEVSVWTAS